MFCCNRKGSILWFALIYFALVIGSSVFCCDSVDYWVGGLRWHWSDGIGRDPKSFITSESEPNNQNVRLKSIKYYLLYAMAVQHMQYQCNTSEMHFVHTLRLTDNYYTTTLMRGDRELRGRESHTYALSHTHTHTLLQFKAKTWISRPAVRAYSSKAYCDIT